MLNTPSPSSPPEPQRVQVLARWLPAVAWAAIIFYCSSLPGNVLPPAPFFSADTVVHLGVYTVLGFLVARALGGRMETRHLLLSCCLCFLYGVSDELHQAFVPGRNPSFMDLGADALGSSLGTITYIRKRQSS